MDDKLLVMQNIHKRFPGVYALKNINFDLVAGEVHALLGENGAGKSTLMKILNGIYNVDEGEIYIEGEKKEIVDVNDAKKYGISIIHQELIMVPEMMVFENIFLGREICDKFGMVDKKAMIEKSKELLKSMNLNIDPTTKLKALTVASQQLIEIIKAVSFNSKIIVMDEPTSSLTDNEVVFLFETIRELVKKGVGIVYISHRMNEIFEISERITVLRDGEYVGTVNTKDTNNQELISMMVGRSLKSYYEREFTDYEETLLEVNNLSKDNELTDISFKLRKGEILGFAGLVGSGRSEVMKCIFGIDKPTGGEIIIDGKKVDIKNPNIATENNLVYVPEDRKEEGLFLIHSLRFNTTIRVLDKFIGWFKYDIRKEKTLTDEYIDYLKIKTPSQEQIIGNLSGGNQQKALIARWLMTAPNILILDEPTRGIDVGAKSEIYAMMNKLAASGVGIIMISSELPEVINMSDRVCVMSGGRIMKTLNRDELSQETIMHYATGGTSHETEIGR